MESRKCREHKPSYQHTMYLDELIPVDKLRKSINRAKQVLSRYDYDSLAFSGMSGALITPALALETGKTLLMVRKRVHPDDYTHSSYDVEGDYAAKRYIIIDDLVASGKTAKRIIKNIYDSVGKQAECLGVLEVNYLTDNNLENITLKFRGDWFDDLPDYFKLHPKYPQLVENKYVDNGIPF